MGVLVRLVLWWGWGYLKGVRLVFVIVGFCGGVFKVILGGGFEKVFGLFRWEFRFWYLGVLGLVVGV